MTILHKINKIYKEKKRKEKNLTWENESKRGWWNMLINVQAQEHYTRYPCLDCTMKSSWSQHKQYFRKLQGPLIKGEVNSMIIKEISYFHEVLGVMAWVYAFSLIQSWNKELNESISIFLWPFSYESVWN